MMISLNTCNGTNDFVKYLKQYLSIPLIEILNKRIEILTLDFRHIEIFECVRKMSLLLKHFDGNVQEL